MVKEIFKTYFLPGMAGSFFGTLSAYLDKGSSTEIISFLIGFYVGYGIVSKLVDIDSKLDKLVDNK